MTNKYVSLYYSCKKSPVTDQLSYNIFKALVQNFSEDIVDVDDKSRKENGMIENLGFEAVPEEQTYEEAEAQGFGFVDVGGNTALLIKDAQK